MPSLDSEQWRLPILPVDLIITDRLFGKEEHPSVRDIHTETAIGIDTQLCQLIRCVHTRSPECHCRVGDWGASAKYLTFKAAGAGN